MLWLPAVFAVALGVAVLGGAVAWHRNVARFHDAAAGGGIGARALSDGVAAGLAFVGLGALLLAVGYLGTIGSLVAPASENGGTLASFSVAAPLYDVGAAVLLGGLGVLVGAMLVAVVVDLVGS